MVLKFNNIFLLSANYVHESTLILAVSFKKAWFVVCSFLSDSSRNLGWSLNECMNFHSLYFLLANSFKTDLINVEKVVPCHNVGPEPKPPGMDGRNSLNGPQFSFCARIHFHPRKDDIWYRPPPRNHWFNTRPISLVSPLTVRFSSHCIIIFIPIHVVVNKSEFT